MAHETQAVVGKIKMIKIEEGPNKGQEVAVKKDMGRLDISSQDLPAVKTWQVGQEYKLEVTVLQTGMRKPSTFDIEMGRAMPEDVEASFDIVGITVPAAQPPITPDGASTPAVDSNV